MIRIMLTKVSCGAHPVKNKQLSDKYLLLQVPRMYAPNDTMSHINEYHWPVPSRAAGRRQPTLYEHPSTRSKQRMAARSKRRFRQATAVNRRTAAADYWQQTLSKELPDRRLRCGLVIGPSASFLCNAAATPDSPAFRAKARRLLGFRCEFVGNENGMHVTILRVGTAEGSSEWQPSL